MSSQLEETMTCIITPNSTVTVPDIDTAPVRRIVVQRRTAEFGWFQMCRFTNTTAAAHFAEAALHVYDRVRIVANDREVWRS